MPRRYPVEFRRKVLDLIEAGKPVAEIAAQLGITAQTVYNWRNQDQIDRGVRAGMSTSESAELSAARKRIRELETELEITRRANELLKAGGPTQKAVGGRRAYRERRPPDRADVPHRGRVGIGVLHVEAPQALGAIRSPPDGGRGDPPGARRVPTDLRRPTCARRARPRTEHDRGALHGRARDGPPRSRWPPWTAEVQEDPEHADGV